MQRPSIVHFLSTKSEDFLCIKALVSLKREKFSQTMSSLPAFDIGVDRPGNPIHSSFPIQAYKLLTSDHFVVNIIGLDSKQNIVYKKKFESDKYGGFDLKIHLDEERRKIETLQMFEVQYHEGLELHLGTYIPRVLKSPKKILICDFDKTLVDTKYSTTRELYTSLTKPINYFPTVQKSVDILKGYIKKDYHPFILSASPHFYENAMRDWLYQNQIFTAGIFLKDYRKIFSVLDRALTTKDLKYQGLYKLNHLIDIILMTGIPEELVLMGDNFESDPIIYASLSKMLKQRLSPWDFCNLLARTSSFQMNRKQKSQLLNKLHHVSTLLNKNQNKILTIYIRKKMNEKTIDLGPDFNSTGESIILYDNNKYLSE